MAFALFHVPHKISYLMHMHSPSFISNKEEINNISNMGVGLGGVQDSRFLTTAVILLCWCFH